MRKHVNTVWLPLLLLLSSVALAQAPADLKPLAARTFTRSFNGNNVSLEYTLRAGPEMEPGKRRFIEIDIDTLLREDAAARGEQAVPLNGFIAIALPPGIEADGELRMKFYNGSTGRYDFMYSAPYPASVLDEQLLSSIADATSQDAVRILKGMREISTALDHSISFQGPQDPRLLGSDPHYAISGASWLIPCNSMIQKLVDPFDPSASMDFNPRLQATLPVRIGEMVNDPRIVVYVGSLSTAVTETTVMSDAIPQNVRLLDPLPVVADSAAVPAKAPVEPAAEGTQPAAAAAEPVENGAALEPPVPAPVSLRALQYSFGWAAWETVIDLSAVIIPSAISPGYQPQEQEFSTEPVNLDPAEGSGSDYGPISITAADPSERLTTENADNPDEAASDSAATEGISLDDAAAAAELAEDAAVADEPDNTEPDNTEADNTEAASTSADDHPPAESETGAANADDGEEAVPGSLAELKQAVEERKEQEAGNSVNIALPPAARETTAPAAPETAALPAEEVAADTDNSEQNETSTEPAGAGESAAAPERNDVPAFAFPEELAASEAAARADEADMGEQETRGSETAADGADFREIEPGSLPGEEDLFSVPLKLISGRDGRRTQGQGSTAPDYTQLYIGGGPAQTPGLASTTPGDLGEMVFVPGGKFLMGTDELASAGDEDERPLHEVEIADFYIDKYPVTNRQYYQFVLSDGYKPQGNWQKYFEPGTADMPVRGVSWDDANAYCRWAGKRLPTEAEWEKAARGEDGRLYPWGDEWSSDILPRGALNYRLVLNQKVASPYGALAMVGVLWQWTASAWAAYPYDPEATGSVKVLRGGAYSNGRNIIRCANRYPEESSVGFNTFTFRCARDK